MMSEKLKTIKELADELGVSKSYVDKIIRILKLHTKLDKVGNKYVISKKQEKSIITRIENSKSTTETHTESTTQSHTKVDAEVDFLKEEIAYLKSNHDKQLTNKDKQIKTLSNLLDQQQRLALQDKKLLEEYKAEINDLKALKMPRSNPNYCSKLVWQAYYFGSGNLPVMYGISDSVVAPTGLPALFTPAYAPYQVGRY
ncbi:DUF536 domain-containing protein [Lactococcus cremoris]|uniref:DUF536 domain-containing protein n=1 Tax=Lactococcus lactis subsp. cremoris TaxID=1359 RepID=UPI002FC9AF06